MTENLMEGLQREIKRNHELLKIYESVGPAGAFASSMIRLDIEKGEEALVSDDVVEMAQAFKSLKENKE